MKKQILSIAACIGISAAAVAQDAPTSKNGYVVLPEAGDYAIQMDATPLLDYALNAVNIMNNTGQTAQHPGYVSGWNQVLVGKYFMSETMAIRGKLAINTMSTTTKNYGDDPSSPSAVGNGTAENVLLSTNRTGMSQITIGGGVEFRRGHNRLQGFYGGEVLIGFGGSSEKNTYEDVLAWDQTAQDSGIVAIGDSRILSQKSGTAITFGLRGFAGVEYFILPKISIGAEFGWGFGVVTNPRGKTETEFWDFETSTATTATNFTEETEGNNGGSSMGFSVDDGASALLGGSAAITATFHF